MECTIKATDEGTLILILQEFSRLASRIHAYEVSLIPTRISHQKYHQIADVSTTEDDYSTVVETPTI